MERRERPERLASLREVSCADTGPARSSRNRIVTRVAGFLMT
jgi:hypothetical protein